MAEPAPASSARPGARRRLRRLLPRVLFVLAASALLFEVGLRVLLFHDHPRVATMARELRSPGKFAHRWSTDYWKLQFQFSDPAKRLKAPIVDSLLGWRSRRLSDQGYRHEGLATLDGARPVLLYGDSFAERTSWDTSWDSLLASSPTGEGRALLNYGVGGYGFDQAFLSFMVTIESAAPHDPFVVLSVLVDDDLDRANLEFRGWPKPRLRLDVDELDFGPALGQSSEDWIAEHPPAITSYAWRYLLFGAELVPAPLRNEWGGRQAAWADTRKICRKLLGAFDRETRKRGLEACVLVFLGKSALQKGADADWREPFLAKELDRLELPYVTTRTDFERDAAQHGHRPGDYVADRGPRKGHYTELGNQVSFRALERALRGQFDGQQKVARRKPRKS